MNFISLLFVLQSLILIASYHYHFPVAFGIEFTKLIHNFQINRLHQAINVLFLLSIWITNWKRFMNIYHFLTSKNIKISAIIIFVYLTLLFFYLEFLPQDYLYPNGVILVVSGAIVTFPHLFPKVIKRKEIKIINPKGLVEDEDKMSFGPNGKGWQTLPINDPQKGILIVGGVGSGKTKSVMEPVLFQMIRRGYAGILYDLKFKAKISGRNFSLTHLAYHCLENFTGEVKPKFFSINFQDPRTSARFNPIAQEAKEKGEGEVKDRTDLTQALEILIGNLKPKQAEKQDFWRDNALAFLKSIIIFLSNQHPDCCTLPHAIALGFKDNATLIAAISSDNEAKEVGKSIIGAYQRAPEQFEGVSGSFQNSVEKLYNKTIFWVLSGKEPLPVVNDPLRPAIVSLGNTVKQSKIFSPILAMLSSMMISKMYEDGRNKSFIMLDELSTIFIPDLNNIVAIGREYRISLIAGFQNFAQMIAKYGAEEAKSLRSTFSNYFIGRPALEDAEYVTKLMGKEVVEEASLTESGEKESKTIHQREQSIITPQEVMKFKSGEFMGKVVHEDGGFFHMKLYPLESYNWKLKLKRFKPLPLACENADVDANFRKIQEDVERIASLYRKSASQGNEYGEEKRTSTYKNKRSF